MSETYTDKVVNIKVIGAGAADTDHKNPCGILCLIYFYF